MCLLYNTAYKLYLFTVVSITDDNLSEFVVLYREHCEVSNYIILQYVLLCLGAYSIMPRGLYSI